MLKIENREQFSKIKAGDIVVKYPLDGPPCNSFTGRNVENSKAYEVAEKNEAHKLVRFSTPESGNTNMDAATEEKAFDELIVEQIWWIANY